MCRDLESSPILEREDQLLADDAQLEAEPDTGPEMAGPMRTCALTRTERPVEEMVRFVAGPDRVIVADLARRLPGRGVWVELSRVRLEQAARRNVFARSLKRPVTVAPDLVARIEALLVKRVVNGLSLANKAGLVVQGFAQVDAALEGGQIACVLHGSDGALGGREKIDRKFKAINESRGQAGFVVTELTIEQMSLAIGRSNVVHAALISGGAATRLLDEAKRLKRFCASPDASPMAF